MNVAATRGYCGKCGTPFSATGYCGKCGSRVVVAAPIASGYSYPVVHESAMPGGTAKLSHRRVIVSALAARGIAVIAVTGVALARQVHSQPCDLYCGPATGTRLVDPQKYDNPKYGFSIEYSGSGMTAKQSSAEVVDFASQDGDGAASFRVAATQDIDQAVQDATNNLDSARFQNLNTVGAVRGAEIAQILGHGTAFTADYTPANGGQSVHVGIVIMAIRHDGITLTAVMFSAFSSNTQHAPYGLDQDQAFDSLVSNLNFGADR